MARTAEKEAQNGDPLGRFEDAMKELDAIVQKMERGDLKLDESLQLFERGMQLSAQCRSSLETAELKVKNLLERHSAPDADG